MILAITRAVILLLAVVALSAQDGNVGICGDESPCDPARPWMRGSIEKSCAHPALLEVYKKDNPDKTFLACDCHHTCNPKDEHAAATRNRTWDPQCEARCNPNNCRCHHVCSET